MKRNMLLISIAVGVALALLAAIPAQAQSGRGCLDRFLVRPGDSLSGIANLYGFDWRVLARLNNLKEPYDIQAGQWICLPAKVGAEQNAGQLHPSEKPAFTAARDGKWIDLEAVNFPARTRYIVRVTHAARIYPQTYARLGVLRTRRGGALFASYQLPEEWRDAGPLLLCLKNASTNAETCVGVIQ